MCLSTGNRYLDIGLSVAVGAVTGGLMAPAMVVGSTVPVAATMAGGIGAFLSGGSLVAASVGASVLGGAAMGLATGVLGAALMPQQQSETKTSRGSRLRLRYGRSRNRTTNSIIYVYFS